MSRVRTTLLRLFALAALFSTAVVLASCGGSDDEDSGPVTAEEVTAAFEDASGGYKFAETTSLVDGAVAVAPTANSDPSELEELNDALGESSVLWQVYVFDGPNPPVNKEAAEEAAFASSKLKSEGNGIYLGDSDTAYVVSGNVVASGPVLDGDVKDETLERWQSVIDGL